MSGDLLIYVLKLLTISGALGCSFVACGKSSVKKSTLFFAGASLTPFVIGSVTMLLSLLDMGVLHVIFYNYLLFVLSLIYLIWSLVRVFKARHAFRYFRPSFTSIVLLILSLSLASAVFNNFRNQVDVPLTNHDSLVYANEARYFAEGRSFKDIPDFGDPENSFSASHPHGFLYQAYLADAIFHQVELNGISDYPVRIAFQATLLYLGCAVIALTSMYGNFIVILGGIVLSLFHHWIQYVSYASSRDAFRVIPVLLIMTLLMYSFNSDREVERSKRFFFLNLFLTFFAVQAHTINIIVVAIIYLVWMAVQLACKGVTGNVPRLLFPAIIGGIAGILHYVKSYLDTGNILGYGFYYYAYYDTPLWSYQQTLYYFNTSDMNVWDKILHYYNFDNDFSASFFSSRFLFLFGLLVNATVIVRNVWSRDRLYRVFLPIVLFALFIPNTGVLDVTTLALSKMFIVNKRYFLHWYVLSGISIAVFLFSRKGDGKRYYYSMHDFFGIRFSDSKSIRFLLLLIIACFTFVSVNIVNGWYRLPVTERVANNPFIQVQEFMSSMPEESLFLIDHLGVDYYTDQRTSFIYSKQNWPLLRAESFKEVAEHLAKNKIEYVVLSLGMDNWWAHSMFGQFMLNGRYAREINRFDKWRIYKVITHVDQT